MIKKNAHYVPPSRNHARNPNQTLQRGTTASYTKEGLIASLVKSSTAQNPLYDQVYAIF